MALIDNLNILSIQGTKQRYKFLKVSDTLNSSRTTRTSTSNTIDALVSEIESKSISSNMLERVQNDNTDTQSQQGINLIVHNKNDLAISPTQSSFIECERENVDHQSTSGCLSMSMVDELISLAQMKKDDFDILNESMASLHLDTDGLQSEKPLTNGVVSHDFVADIHENKHRDDLDKFLTDSYEEVMFSVSKTEPNKIETGKIEIPMQTAVPSSQATSSVCSLEKGLGSPEKISTSTEDPTPSELPPVFFVTPHAEVSPRPAKESAVSKPRKPVVKSQEYLKKSGTTASGRFIKKPRAFDELCEISHASSLRKKCQISRPTDTYCICKGPDDGSMMLRCDGCEEWFHCKCVRVTDNRAEEMTEMDIKWYCPGCKSLNYE